MPVFLISGFRASSVGHAFSYNSWMMFLHDAFQPLQFVCHTAIGPIQLVEMGVCSPVSPKPALYVVVLSMFCICIFTVLFESTVEIAKECIESCQKIGLKYSAVFISLDTKLLHMALRK